MGIFFKDKKQAENAVQVNPVSKAPVLCGWGGVFPLPGAKGKRDYAASYLWVCLSRIIKGISNTTLYTKTADYTAKGICEWVMENSTLLFTQYVYQGYMAVRYNSKSKEYAVLSPNEVKTDQYGRVINRDAVAVYSPEYSTFKKTPVLYCKPILDILNDLCNTMSAANGTMGVLPVLSGSSIPANPKYKEDLAKMMGSEYGWGDEQIRYFLSQSELKVDTIDLKIKDMELRDNILAKFKELLVYWNIPTPLVIDTASSYNNMTEARKDFYSTCIRYYAETLLSLAQALLTASDVFLPKSAINYGFYNVPEMEKTISSFCEEQKVYLELLDKFAEKGVDVEEDIKNAYEELKRRIKEV